MILPDDYLFFVTLSALAFAQNVSLSMVSRSRNRSSMKYHAVCSGFSNGVGFLTLHQLIMADLTHWMILPYVIGAVCGSLLGAKVSMFIERAIGAKADV